MSRTELTSRQKVYGLLGAMAVLAVVIGLGLLLRARAPGNMGVGFLQGAAVGVLAVIVMAWRLTRDPDGATTFERAFTQQGDEREDEVLTRALAVLGLLSFPLTSAAVIAIGLGAEVPMILFFLLIAQLLVGAAAFVTYSRLM